MALLGLEDESLIATVQVMTEVLSNYDKTENLAVRYRFNCSDFPMLIIPTENFAAGATKVLLTVDSNDGMYLREPKYSST